ncbi:MAG TPA: SCP2 sterol-binding domain-containing protein [Candidatus Bathyarchaeia archaeon]|nr:SCP2 sterol-binding domain-containing protein [Candidatus Bathyarchaeia archaeon]
MSDASITRKPFPSKEWVTSYMEALNRSEEYAKTGKGWQWGIMFVINELPESLATKLGSKSAAFSLDLHDGKCLSYEWVENPEATEVPYKLSGKYSIWTKVITGKLNPTQAMLTGQLRVKGDLVRLLKYTAAAVAMVKAAQEVPTEIV